MNYDIVKNLLFVKCIKNKIYKIINLDSISYAEEDYSGISSIGNTSVYINDKTISIPCDIEEFSRIMYAYKKGLEAIVWIIEEM